MEGQFEENLEGVVLLRGVDRSDLPSLARLCRWRRYAPQQQVIGQEEANDDVFFLISGSVRITVYSASGSQVSFRDLGQGECFGELAAIDGKPRSASVIALGPSFLASLTAGRFRNLLHTQPAVTDTLLRSLVTLVRRLSERVVDHATLTVRDRIRAELLRLAEESGPHGDTAVLRPRPHHAQLASRISTHREAVTRELNDLARRGILEQRRDALIIRDVRRLAEMVREMRGH